MPNILDATSLMEAVGYASKTILDNPVGAVVFEGALLEWSRNNGELNLSLKDNSGDIHFQSHLEENAPEWEIDIALCILAEDFVLAVDDTEED